MVAVLVLPAAGAGTVSDVTVPAEPSFEFLYEREINAVRRGRVNDDVDVGISDGLRRGCVALDAKDGCGERLDLQEYVLLIGDDNEFIPIGRPDESFRRIECFEELLEVAAYFFLNGVSLFHDLLCDLHAQLHDTLPAGSRIQSAAVAPFVIRATRGTCRYCFFGRLWSVRIEVDVTRGGVQDQPPFAMISCRTHRILSATRIVILVAN